VTPTLASITFDCADAVATARFWSAVLDRPMPDDASPEYVLLPGSPAWSFFAVPEPKAGKNRVHVDLAADDRDAVVDRLLALGATRLGDFEEGGYRWTTLADPEGNEFDVVAA
jgi:catechol 2,3-dioxygenase-like lactoylglutathione lyase family enzyme